MRTWAVCIGKSALLFYFFPPYLIIWRILLYSIYVLSLFKEVFEFTVFMSLIVESMCYPLEVLMGLPTQGTLSIWQRSWNFNILFCLANGSLFSFCGNNQLELLLQNDYCVIHADTLHMVWHGRWLLQVLVCWEELQSTHATFPLKTHKSLIFVS